MNPSCYGPRSLGRLTDVAAAPFLHPVGSRTTGHSLAQVAEAESKAACNIATSHGALRVDYLHIFGGPDGTADPAPFLGPDHAHPGETGIQAISDALAQLGVAELTQ